MYFDKTVDQGKLSTVRGTRERAHWIPAHRLVKRRGTAGLARNGPKDCIMTPLSMFIAVNKFGILQAVQEPTRLIRAPSPEVIESQ